jgi:hypothetical protein
MTTRHHGESVPEVVRPSRCDGPVLRQALCDTRCDYGSRDGASISARLRAASCDFLRTFPCVGFCVALGHKSAYYRGQSRLFSLLLGELRPPSQEVARSRRRSQVLLRLVLLMGVPFFRCDALRAESATDFASPRFCEHLRHLRLAWRRPEDQGYGGARKRVAQRDRGLNACGMAQSARRSDRRGEQSFNVVQGNRHTWHRRRVNQEGSSTAVAINAQKTARPSCWELDRVVLWSACWIRLHDGGHLNSMHLHRLRLSARPQILEQLGQQMRTGLLSRCLAPELAGEKPPGPRRVVDPGRLTSIPRDLTTRTRSFEGRIDAHSFAQPAEHSDRCRVS